MTTSSPRFSVIVPNFNGRHYLEDCLASLEACHFPRNQVEYILVDNGSTDGSAEFVQAYFPSVQLVRNDHNVGFTGAIAAGVEAARGENLVFLNNDMRVQSQWLSAFEAVLCGEKAECATGRILNWDGTRVDFEEGILLHDGHALQRYHGAKAENFRNRSVRSAFIACGGNMAVRKELFTRLGGFDRDFFAYTEDVDFSWRLNAAGHRISFVPEAAVFHRHQGTSSGLGIYNRGYLYEKNAYLTLFKNIEALYFNVFMHLAWTTLIHRTREIIAINTQGSEVFARDPFAEKLEAASESPPAEPVGSSLKRGFSGLSGLLKSIQRYLRDHGYIRTLGHSMSRLGQAIECKGSGQMHRFAESQEVSLRHPHIISQFQAIWYIMANMEGIAQKRKQVQNLRQVSDQLIFQEFPPWLVTTYPGDARLFNSSWFRDMLPDGIPFRSASLDEVHGDP